MIRNKKTGQMYIGQSKNIENRFRAHRNTSQIDVDIANNGAENFDFIILEEVPKIQEQLDKSEQYWIEYYNACNSNHYNRSIGGYKKRYTLWDVTSCWYDRYAMNRTKSYNLCKCFRFVYNGQKIHIGNTFYDFVSCEIINKLIKEAIKDEIK